MALHPQCSNDPIAKRLEIESLIAHGTFRGAGMPDDVRATLQVLYREGAFRHQVDVAYAALMLDRGEPQAEIAAYLASEYVGIPCDPVTPAENLS